MLVVRAWSVKLHTRNTSILSLLFRYPKYVFSAHINKLVVIL